MGEGIESSESFSIEEARLLGGYPPFISVLRLMIGPLISQLSVSSYYFFDSIWISYFFNQDGMTVLGACSLLRLFPTMIAQYISTSISLQISYLLGQDRHTECSQLFVDFVRLSLIIGIIVPIIFLPTIKPFIRFDGGSGNIPDLSFEYCLPIFSGSFIIVLYMCCCGTIQSEGHSVLYGTSEVLCLILSVGLLEPLFLYFFKFGLYASTLARLASQLIVGAFLLIQICHGKFLIHPKKEMFFSKFSPETFAALIAGLSNLLNILSAGLPLFLCQKYLLKASTAVNQYEAQSELWAIVVSLCQFAEEVPLAISDGTVPLISYAFGANKFKRILQISLSTIIVSLFVCACFSVPLVFFPKTITSIWSNDNFLLSLAEKAVPTTFYMSLTWCFQYVVCVLLEAMKEIKLSLLNSFLCTFFSLPIISTILYYTGKTDPLRLYWTFPIDDIWSLVLSIIFVIKPIRECIKKSKQKNEQALLFETTEQIYE